MLKQSNISFKKETCREILRSQNFLTTLTGKHLRLKYKAVLLHCTQKALSSLFVFLKKNAVILFKDEFGESIEKTICDGSTRTKLYHFYMKHFMIPEKRFEKW